MEKTLKDLSDKGLQRVRYFLEEYTDVFEKDQTGEFKQHDLKNFSEESFLLLKEEDLINTSLFLDNFLYWSDNEDRKVKEAICSKKTLSKDQINFLKSIFIDTPDLYGLKPFLEQEFFENNIKVSVDNMEFFFEDDLDDVAYERNLLDCPYFLFKIKEPVPFYCRKVFDRYIKEISSGELDVSAPVFLSCGSKLDFLLELFKLYYNKSGFYINIPYFKDIVSGYHKTYKNSILFYPTFKFTEELKRVFRDFFTPDVIRKVLQNPENFISPWDDKRKYDFKYLVRYLLQEFFTNDYEGFFYFLREVNPDIATDILVSATDELLTENDFVDMLPMIRHPLGYLQKLPPSYKTLDVFKQLLEYDLHFAMFTFLYTKEQLESMSSFDRVRIKKVHTKLTLIIKKRIESTVNMGELQEYIDYLNTIGYKFSLDFIKKVLIKLPKISRLSFVKSFLNDDFSVFEY